MELYKSKLSIWPHLEILNSQVKWRQAALLERDILLKNLKSVLESLRSRVAGKHKDEIEESLSMVCFLL